MIEITNPFPIYLNLVNNTLNNLIYILSFYQIIAMQWRVKENMYFGYIKHKYSWRRQILNFDPRCWQHPYTLPGWAWTWQWLRSCCHTRYRLPGCRVIGSSQITEEKKLYDQFLPYFTGDIPCCACRAINPRHCPLNFLRIRVDIFFLF